MKFSALLVSLIVAPLASPHRPPEQTGLPRITSVEPAAAAPGDILTARGENLGAAQVAELFLTDGRNDLKVPVVEQTPTSITFRIPPTARPARYALMVLTKTPRTMLIEMPAAVTVQTGTARDAPAPRSPPDRPGPAAAPYVSTPGVRIGDLPQGLKFSLEGTARLAQPFDWEGSEQRPLIVADADAPPLVKMIRGLVRDPAFTNPIEHAELGTIRGLVVFIPRSGLVSAKGDVWVALMGRLDNQGESEAALPVEQLRLRSEAGEDYAPAGVGAKGKVSIPPHLSRLSLAPKSAMPVLLIYRTKGSRPGDYTLTFGQAPSGAE